MSRKEGARARATANVVRKPTRVTKESDRNDAPAASDMLLSINPSSSACRVKIRSQDNRSSRTDVAQAGNTTNSCRAQRRFLVGTRHDAGHNLMIGATLLPEIS